MQHQLLDGRLDSLPQTPMVVCTSELQIPDTLPADQRTRSLYRDSNRSPCVIPERQAQDTESMFDPCRDRPHGIAQGPRRCR